jgi:hypothetical protein
VQVDGYSPNLSITGGRDAVSGMEAIPPVHALCEIRATEICADRPSAFNLWFASKTQ